MIFELAEKGKRKITALLTTFMGIIPWLFYIIPSSQTTNPGVPLGFMGKLALPGTVPTAPFVRTVISSDNLLLNQQLDIILSIYAVLYSCENSLIKGLCGL